MNKTIEESVAETMDLYHRKISPNNKGWKVLSVESGLTDSFENIYRRFGVGNDFFAVDILNGSTIPEGGWDLIIISEVIQYIYDFLGLLDECHKLLKPGGFLIVDCPFVAEYDNKSKYEEYWRISHKALQRILTNLGFEYGNSGLVNGHLTSALARKAKNE